MSRFKVRYLLLLAFFHHTGELFAQNTELSSNVDSAYNMVLNAGNPVYSSELDTISVDSPNFELVVKLKMLAFERANVAHRKLGMEFWQRFPKDDRKYEWFERTVGAGSTGIHYWKFPEIAVDNMLQSGHPLSSYEAELDYISLSQWEKLYPVFRNEYFSYLKRKSTVDGHNYSMAGVLTSEMGSFFTLARNRKYRAEKYFSTSVIDSAIQDKMSFMRGVDEDDNAGFKSLLNWRLLSGYRFMGLNEDSLFNLISRLENWDYLPLFMSKWADQTINLLNLTKAPMELRLKLPSGELFDLQKWRLSGSVVLVDIWALSCKSCIRRMSYLRELYEKYKSDGFSIISLCANNMEDKSKVEEVKKRIGANWETLLIGLPAKGNAAYQIWEQYGFRFVPHMFLLDKSGRVVIYNNELVAGDMEFLLKELLVKR